MSDLIVKDPLDGEDAKLLLTARDNRGRQGNFAYYKGKSGHVFLHDIPADLDAYYEEGYQAIPNNEAELAEAARTDAYRIEIIRKLVPSGEYLEIGPWIGLVAYTAKQCGYNVTVLERSPECCALLENAGIHAVRTNDPAKSLAESDQTYDVVALWHSIEHLPRPWEVIAEAAKKVNPGGVLLVSAPNPDSVQFEQLGTHWYHLDAPRHIHLLPSSVVENIGRDNGLRTVEVTTDDTLGDILDRAGWAYEAQRKVKNLPVLKAISRRVLGPYLQRKHRGRKPLDGAGFTVVMTR